MQHKHTFVLHAGLHGSDSMSPSSTSTTELRSAIETARIDGRVDSRVVVAVVGGG